jgi:hypothetical protein
MAFFLLILCFDCIMCLEILFDTDVSELESVVRPLNDEVTATVQYIVSVE